MTRRRATSCCSLSLGATLLALACGDPRPTVGSETHWMRICTRDAQCGPDASCVCGVCSRSCDVAGDCALAGSLASCASGAPLADELCGALAAPGLCLAPCTGDASCAAVGPGLVCSGGACVPDPARFASCPVKSEPTPPSSEASACPDVDSPGASLGVLPGTAVEYCVKAHPSCLDATVTCPLYVMSNTGVTWFDRVDQPELYGAFVIALSYGATDVSADSPPPRDWAAELPRQLVRDFPGIDRERVYMVGWSGGVGAVYRSQCQASKAYDQSPYGTTSDLYAAIATVGGCAECDAGFTPLDGNFHAFSTAGREDPYGGDGCEEELRRLAGVNGCSAPGAPWRPVAPDDPFVSGAVSARTAERLEFGSCARGDVLGYRFAGEDHVVSYGNDFDPPVSAYELAWEFLQGRTKHGGVQGTELVCR